MNLLDIIVFVVLLVCSYAGYSQGLIRTLFRLVSFFAAIFLASQLYPYVSRLLIQTALYDTIKSTVIDSLGLSAYIQEHTTRQANELINSLPLPDALKSLLQNYNTPDMYALLNVNTVEEYVGGFFANMAINVISIVLVFLVVMIGLRIIGGVLDIIGKLPIIRTLNHAGGLAAGFALGVVLVWIGLVLLSLLFISPANAPLYEMWQGSLVAKWLYDNNWMLQIVTKTN